MDETQQCGKALTEWPYGDCTEPAGHAGDCDRRQLSKRTNQQIEPEAPQENVNAPSEGSAGKPQLWRLVQWQNGAIVDVSEPESFAEAKTLMEILQKAGPNLGFAIEPVREEKKPDVTDDSAAKADREGPWFALGDRVAPRGWESSQYHRAGLNVFATVVETKPITGSKPARQQFRAEGADWCGSGSMWNHSDDYVPEPDSPGRPVRNKCIHGFWIQGGIETCPDGCNLSGHAEPSDWGYAIEPVREEKKPDVTVYYRVEVKMSGHWQTYRGNLTREAAEVAVGHNALHPVRAIKITEEVVEGWGS